MRAVVKGRPIVSKLISAAVMYGVFGAVQGLIELLRVAPRIFSPEELRAHPWISAYDHHWWQLVLALVAVAGVSRGRASAWGLNVANWRLSLKLFWRFVPIFTLVIVIWNVLPPLLSGHPPRFNYEVTTANVIGWMTYMWLFAGISEEILFRGLIQTYLSKTWTENWSVGGVTIPSAGFAATIIFCLAHIDGWPVNWPQQLFAFGLGIFYSVVYQRTGSLLTPMLAHNFSNGIIMVALYGTYWWLR